MEKNDIIKILEGGGNLEEGFLDRLGAKMRGWEQSNNNSYNNVIGRGYENQDPETAKSDKYIEFMVDKLTNRFIKTLSDLQDLNNKELSKDLKRMFGDDDDYIKKVRDNIETAVSTNVYERYLSDIMD